MNFCQEVLLPRRKPRNPISPAPVTCTIEKSIPSGMLFFCYTSKVQVTGLEGECSEGLSKAFLQGVL